MKATTAEQPVSSQSTNPQFNSATSALGSEAELFDFVARGAMRFNPRSVARLMSELPGIRERLPELETAGFPRAATQLAFLADVLEGFVMQEPAFASTPYRASLEAAFAVHYFNRADDIVPDIIGPLGYLDDAAVAAAVLARNAEAFEPLATALRSDWRELAPTSL